MSDRLPPLGSYVRQYRLEEFLGRGAYGAVFRGLDAVLGREVALKTLHPELAMSPRSRRAFLREAQNVCQLAHPAIVSVYEYFESEGFPWIVMELVSGRTLRDRVTEEGALAPEAVVNMGIALADALASAHAAGFLHRDIKPSNILGADGRTIKLADFGLAKHLLDDESRTRRGDDGSTATFAALGTPRYMSPEQILGTDQQLDGRSDIYSLGVVLHEACTGTRAFDGPSERTIFGRVLQEELPLARQLNPRVSAALSEVIDRCVRKDRDERFANATELQEALREIQESGTLTRTRTKGPGWSRRLPRKATGRWIAAALGVAVVSVGIGWFLSRATPDGLPRSTPRAVTSSAEFEREPCVSPSGDAVAFVGVVGGRPQIFVGDASGGGGVLQLTRDDAEKSTPAWMPDGSAILYTARASGIPGIWKVPRLGGAPIEIVHDAASPAVSPDGKQIAFARQGSLGFRQIHVASLAEPSRSRALTTRDHGVWDHDNPAWSPDGRTLAYADQRDIWIVDVDGGVPAPLTRDDFDDDDPVWSPSGEHVYFSSTRNGATAVWRISRDERVMERVTLGSANEQRPTISRDGRILAYGTALLQSLVEVVDRDTKRRKIMLEGWGIEMPTFAPDGSALVYTALHGDMTEIVLQPIDGLTRSGEKRRITDLHGSCSVPSMSPDGRFVAFHGVLAGQRDIWVAPTSGAMAANLTRAPSIDIYPRFSPDGKRLAFVSDRGGTHQIWVADFADGRLTSELRALTNLGEQCAYQEWSPDGRSMAFVGVVDRASDLYVIDADSGTPPRRLTLGAQVELIAWDAISGEIVALGAWGEPAPSLRYVDPKTGSTRAAAELAPDLATGSILGVAFSGNGRFFASSVRDGRGDVWVLEAVSGSF